MRKVLIANRGEIARRIIRTAHRVGLETVAVYSEADANAPHVREAGQAVPIGPAPASESYLDATKLVAAAQRTGADAIHPGYGFLSENADFAEAVRAAGLIFVGPPTEAIRVMGLKDTAKRAAKHAGVPVTPGYQGDDQSLTRLERAAQAIGYPILIKAVAGGGGKGMRRVDDRAAFSEALVAAKREAGQAFGNDGVLIEKLITRPRHVEVQIFADSHGNVVHLFERDCSLQRRHQKVIEESPAPGLSDRLRHTLGIAAVSVAHAISYEGAGTVEFILDMDTLDDHGDPAFYFMEMNTRLQVEHPVTELVTGFDLVEWQFRVAAGEQLPATQERIIPHGHAIEARLYAEDAEGGFLPSTGTLRRLSLPSGMIGVRIDSGVEQGSSIGIHYDPMIAKIIAYGIDRSAAIDRLVGALDACIVEGVKTNRAFLARLADHPAFRSGDVDTGFIERHAETLKPEADIPDAVIAVAALALVEERDPQPHSVFERLGDWRLNLPMVRHLDLYADGELPRRLALAANAQGYRITGLGEPMQGTARWRDGQTMEAVLDGNSLRAVVLIDDGFVEVRAGGRAFRLCTRQSARSAGSHGAQDGRITAPMPGRVLSLAVKPGQKVEAGERLLVLEAMKMEHRLTAPGSGTVRNIAVSEGDQVTEATLLVELELIPSP